jgi:hypothetical protein
MAEADKFDRQILNLSAAGLALSIVFLAISTAAYAFPILYASWVAFIVAMMASILGVLLVSHPAGAKVSRIFASMSFVLAIVLTVAFVYLNLDALAQDGGVGGCDDAVYDT